MSDPGILIVGASYAGLNAAVAVRNADPHIAITLVGNEAELPYQRPPLSKEYLRDGGGASKLALRPAAYYESNIDLRLSTNVASIDRQSKVASLESGEKVAYRKLILATGCRPRLLAVPGSEAGGIHYLRTMSDARDIAEGIPTAGSVVIVGGGFIGLEIAASLRRMGKEVSVIEALPRLLSRSLSPEVASYIAGWHEREGVQFHFGAQVARFQVGAMQQVTAVELSDGRQVPADMVIVGIGVVPNVELAQRAGIHCDNGIVVDKHCRTSDLDVYAAGDCTSHPNPFATGMVRLECVQNANDQGKVAGRNAIGESGVYESPPWFWSDQYEVKLQGVGISTGYDRVVVRGKMEENTFSVFYYAGTKLLAVDSINKPGEHMLARKLLVAKALVSDAQAADTGYDLRQALTAS